MRPIDADALIRDIELYHVSDGQFQHWVESQPTIDVEPVRYGHWVYDPNGMDWGLPAWICSECHCQNNNIPTHIRGKDSMIRVTEPLRWEGSDYCPNCGAKMRKEE